MKVAVLGDIHSGRDSIIVNWWDHFLPRSPLEVTEPAIKDRLERFVQKANDIDVDIVLSVGDLTESGWPKQFKIFKSIIKDLKAPFVPIMGNHDIWPYYRDTSGKVKFQTKKPLAFKQWKEIFGKDFQKLSEFNYQEQEGSLYNFSIDYQNIRVVALDNVSRQKAPLFLPGSIGRAQLYPESLEWLQCSSRCREKNLIIVSHFPLDILRSHEKNIVAIHGHTHRYKLARLKNVTSIAANALYIDPVIPIIEITDSEVAVNLLSLAR